MCGSEYHARREENYREFFMSTLRRICPVCQHGLKVLVSPISAFPEHPRRGVVAICLCCVDLIIARKNNTFVRFPGENFSLLSLEDRAEIAEKLKVISHLIDLHKKLAKSEGEGPRRPPQAALRKAQRKREKFPTRY